MTFRKTATHVSGSCFGGIKPVMSVHDQPLAESSDVLLAALERANDAVVILDQPAGALGLNDLGEDRRTELTITRPGGDRLRVALSLSHVTSGGVHRTIALVRDITPDL